MIKLFFDIETIPEDESVSVEQENRERYSLNKKFGKILCIGYIKNIPPTTNEEVITGNEPQLLERFWNIAKDVDIFIGHNIYEFDLLFILYRSDIHKVKVTQKFNLLSYRSESDRIYDTLREGKRRYGEYMKLEKLAERLGVAYPKTEMDGSKVYFYHKAGRDKEIYDYCMRDVKTAKEIYNKMIVKE